MGFRTVVIFNNDLSREWQKDPTLGDKISHASYDRNFEYGRVVECCHADTLTMGIIDSVDFKPMVYDSWRYGERDDETQVRLLKRAAEELGYRLVKKRA
jgi:hypothetical protein